MNRCQAIEHISFKSQVTENYRYIRFFKSCVLFPEEYLSKRDIRRLLLFVIFALIVLLFYTSPQCQIESPCLISPIHGNRSLSLRATISTTKSPLTRMIVISHFNEDLDWLPLFIGQQIPYIVYTRSNDYLARHSIKINKGREAVAYLRYIVDNYANLSSSIAFIHAHRTSWHQKNPSDIVVALRTIQWHKYPYMPLTDTRTASSFQLHSTDQQLKVNFELWRDVLQKELGPPPTNGVETYCCASFVAKKEAILAHPKEFYSKIIDYMIASPYSDQLTGRTLEYTWHMIFGQSAHINYRTCDIFVCDSNGTISVTLADKNPAINY